MPGARLTVEERIVLADLLLAGATAAAIGRQLGRHRSTICREIKRNSLPSPYGYRPHAAHSQSCARAPRPKPRKLAPGTALRERVVSDLRRGWSPQQIAGRLAREHPDEPGLRVSHETIYHAWYVGGRGSLRLALQTEARIERSRRSTRDRPESLRGKLARSAYTVQSTYFLVEADAWFGRVHLRYHALLARSSAANPSIVWMRRAYGTGTF